MKLSVGGKETMPMAWLARNPDVVSTELERGAILLNLGTRLYYTLNDVGLVIWRSVTSAGSPDTIVNALRARYEVDEDTAQGAVSRMIEAFERAQLVVAANRNAVAGSDGSGWEDSTGRAKRQFSQPTLVRHDEPLHEVSISPYDAQLPLAE
jgi:hypothetical protein